MLRLTVVTPQRKLISDAEVEEVFVPTVMGEINILSGHASLVASLSSGILKYRVKGSTQLERAAISWGYCEVFADSVGVLADLAEFSNEIDIEEARAAIKDVEAKLAAPEITPEEVVSLNRKLQNQRTRLQLLSGP